mmetsp:Transcript_16772/g.25522  ORF Transcript_16772/g.25522 Transcript_16772/m.25522 type:complete len:370 (-) Transcript_16772:50-1159(-)
MTEDSRTIQVDHQDGRSEYISRGLNEGEIREWAEFCASVFSYKANPPPPSYFERHYYNDPRREATLIRVIIHEGEIVSSCRIFLRTISLGAQSSAIEAGGIGEVCTSPRHRKRGLSKFLLHDALNILKRIKIPVSLLHAAPIFFPVYERGGGYASIVSSWSLLTLDARKLYNYEFTIGTALMEANSFKANFRLANFPLDAKRLQALHQKYSEHRFVGCIVRSTEYWNEYLSKELDGRIHVMTKSIDDQDALAWMSLRRRVDRLQLVEFGYDTSILNDNSKKNVLWQLFAHCCSSCYNKDENEASLGQIKLHLPTFVFNDLKETTKNSIIISSEVASDLGWMYASLQEDSIDMVKITEKMPHLIWPSDSF